MNPEVLKAIKDVARDHSGEYIAMGREDGIENAERLAEKRATRKQVIGMAKAGASLDLLSQGFHMPYRKIKRILKRARVKIPPRSL